MSGPVQDSPGVHAAERANVSSAHVTNPPLSNGVVLWLCIAALILGSLGFTFGLISYSRTAEITGLARDTGNAAAKAEIAEKRANISELYAKQVFVELNRLGYPVKTPGEDHSVAPVEKP